MEAYLSHKFGGNKRFQTENNQEWVGKRSFEKLQYILCKQPHYFDKCDYYKGMNGREKIKPKGRSLLCKSYLKNRYLQREHAKKHNYFVKKKAEDYAVEDDTKVCRSQT